MRRTTKVAENINVQIIVSEDMEVQSLGQGQIHKIVNSVLKMRVPFIPGGLTFAISIITSGINFNKPHDFEIYVENPRKNEGDEYKVLYTTGNQHMDPIPHQTDNFNFNIDLKNVAFFEEGVYNVVFMFDDKEYTHSFEIVANQKLTQG